MLNYFEGPKNAKIAFVGEAPGEREVLSGRPFVGKAGGLLDNLMRGAGINRLTCYIDNVFQERPDRNDASVWLDLSKREPRETEFYRESKAALLERLRKVSPNIIVALGNIPLYTLTGTKGITKYRGSLLYNEELSTKILPTIHPSAALRQYIWRYLIIFDLIRAKKESGFPEYKPLKRCLITKPTLNQIYPFLERCLKAESVAFDIEVSRAEVSHISFALSPDEALCIPFQESGRNIWTPSTETGLWLEIAKILENEGIEKITQNGTFDATFLLRRFGIHTRPIQDTMIAQGILWPDLPKGLGMLTSLYCDGEPYYKDDGKKWMKNPFSDELSFQRYNAMDSAVLMQIWPAQKEELKKAGNERAYEVQRSFIEPLIYMGEHGIKVDLDKLDRIREENKAFIKEKERELTKMCGGPINYNSPKQVQEYFYIRKGLRPHTKQGRITVNDEALKMIAGNGHIEASTILELRHARKMHGTYYEMVLDSDYRMRCSYNPAGTKSGRISSSKTIFGTGGNLQNQPHIMLSCMVPDPGMLAISMDLAQAENRVVAYVAREPRMIEAFEQDLDIHSYTASLIYNIPYEEVTHEQRQTGKKANHGLNYGLGYVSFANLHQMPRDRARDIVEGYHKVYGRLREWHQTIQSELRRSHTLSNLYGRKRVFRDRWGDSLFKEAYSYIPQSTIGIKTLLDGQNFLYYEDDPYIRETEILATVHDSIKFQVPISLGADKILYVIEKTKHNLENPLTAYGQSFVIPVDTAFGYNLGDDDIVEWKYKDYRETPRPKLIEQLEAVIKKAP